MTKNKPIKKKEYFMKTHSRKTGKIILVALACLLILTAVFLYLAISESDRLDKIEQNFRLLNCAEMKENFDRSVEEWKYVSMQDKGCL